MDNIGDRIRKYRERTGFSQKKLGTSLGLSDKAISSYESGRTIPSIETLLRIAKELDVSMDDLWESSTKNSAISKLDLIEKDLKDLLGEIKEIRKKIESL